MAYTSHGHVIPGLIHIPGARFDGQVKRCGGPGMCSVCSIEAIQAQKDVQLFAINQDAESLFVSLRRTISKDFKSDFHKEQALLRLTEAEMWLSHASQKVKIQNWEEPE